MPLELEITSYHRLSPLVKAKWIPTQSSSLIGRSDSCDWHLPDPERIVSSQHALIECKDNQYWIIDKSTNGVFINDSNTPIGKDTRQLLHDGDTVRVGDYEIQAHQTIPKNISNVKKEEGTETSVTDFLHHKHFVENTSNKNKTAENELSNRKISQPTQWELASTISANQTHHTENGTYNNQLNNLISGLSENGLLDSTVSIPTSLPDDWDWLSTEKNINASTSKGDTSSNNAMLSELIAALGIEDRINPNDIDPAFCKDLGLLVRSLLDHLIDTLHRRAALKNIARVQQTLFKQTENNPLKFSTNGKDAIESLLVKKRASFLGVKSAIDDAFSDINDHEEALLSGLQAVITDSLKIQKKKSTRWGFLSNRRTLRCIYEDNEEKQLNYADISRILRSDTFIEGYENSEKTRT